MQIDLEKETPITLSAGARECPGRPHVATVWRWAVSGVKGEKLETVSIGGRRYTTREAIQRFISATTARANGTPAPAVRTPAARQRAIDAAKQELAKAGI